MNYKIHVLPTNMLGGAENFIKKNIINKKKTNILVFLTYTKKRQYFEDDKFITYYIGFNIFRLFQIIKKYEATAIHFWMYKAIFFSIAMFPLYFFLKNKLFCWHIRHNLQNLKYEQLKTIFIYYLIIPFSFIPNYIFFNSHSSKKNHYFLNKNKIIIPNYQEIIPLKQRTEIKKNYGFVGRYNKLKNCENLVRSFLELDDTYKLHLFGRDLKNKLDKFIPFHKKSSFIFHGVEYNKFKIYNCFDFLILPSYSESFPNVIIEAINFSTIPLCTNCGDSFEINPFGFHIKNYDYKSIKKIIIASSKISTMEYNEITNKNHSYIAQNYSNVNVSKFLNLIF